MTTAQARTEARAAEKALNWIEAARLWELAVANYPRPYPKLGAMAEMDIAKMSANATSCRAQSLVA